jgi:hypothetical protein
VNQTIKILKLCRLHFEIRSVGTWDADAVQFEGRT